MTFTRRSKYGAKRTEIDGVTFASKRESVHYARLKLLEKAGEITQLVLQPPFPIVVNGIKVGKYLADFSYRSKDGVLHVIDVKGMKTPMYRLKKKLVEAIYRHINIEEVN